MGIVQSKRKTRLSEDVSDKINHRSMFAEKPIPIAASKRGHHSTLPRSTGKSTLQHPSTHAAISNRSVPALSTISLPPKPKREDTNTTYIGLESSSRFLPDDWDSQDRGLTLHFGVKKLFDGNVMPAVLSWFNDNARVVDIGCLNGSWLMDMAVQYPKCQFVGIETAQSPSTVIPQVLSMHNVRFESVESETRRIPLADASVDVCHMRAQSLNFEQRPWLNLLSEAYRILKPGGVVQITDFHFAMTGTVLVESFIDTVRNILNAMGMDLDVALKLDSVLAQNGFNIVESKRTKVHFASHGQLGEDFIAATLGAFENAHELLAPKMGLEEEEYRQRVEMVCAQCVQQDAHLDWYAIVGRKPMISS